MEGREFTFSPSLCVYAEIERREPENWIEYQVGFLLCALKCSWGKKQVTCNCLTRRKESNLSHPTAVTWDHSLSFSLLGALVFHLHTRVVATSHYWVAVTTHVSQKGYPIVTKKKREREKMRWKWSEMYKRASLSLRVSACVRAFACHWSRVLIHHWTSCHSLSLITVSCRQITFRHLFCSSLAFSSLVLAVSLCCVQSISERMPIYQKCSR